jgi:hypothetical protein
MPYVHKIKYYVKNSKSHISKEKMNFSFVLKINQIKVNQIIFIVVPNKFVNKLKYNIFIKINFKSIIIYLKSPQHIVSQLDGNVSKVHDSTNRSITIFKMSQLTTC